MSVRDEITRLETAKSDIETAIETCGVNVPDTEKISAYASYIRQIPSAIFSELNVAQVGGADAYIKTIKQTNGVIKATTGGLVSSSSSGLTPKIGTASSATISKQADEWVLTSTKGATPTWRKLPVNAFKNDNDNTTYTLSGALDGNTFVSTLTPSSGSPTTATVPAMTGASSNAAGKAGLVPAPAKNNEGKFLRGDGTWAIPSKSENSYYLYTQYQDSTDFYPNYKAYLKWIANDIAAFHFTDGTYKFKANLADSVPWTGVTGRPTALSEFTDDILANHYLPLSGGQLTGNLTLYAGSGNSPYIRFQRGSNKADTLCDWTIVDEGGYLIFREGVNGAEEDVLKICGSANTSAFTGSVSAASFVGSLTGNASSSTYATYLGTKDSNYSKSSLDSALADRYSYSTSRTKNTVLAAPNGSDGSATFRALVAADLPSHNHSSAQITSLTSYTKATKNGSLATTDTLNSALGKLEYKADLGKSAYDIISAAYDGDGVIENLTEILKVLKGISDTNTITSIIGKYLPLTGGSLSSEAYISWTDRGAWGNSSAVYPYSYGGLSWSGTSDWIKLYGKEEISDKLNLIIEFGDDSGHDIKLIDNGTERIVMHSGNYTSYTVEKDGTGATGTWSINIAGNAATATNAGNADTLDSYHANTGQTPFGKIPTIATDGVMEIGKYIDFHHDNTAGKDYSTRLYCQGEYGNVVKLPTTNGTIALTSQIPSTLANPEALTIFGVAYDGSAAKTVTATTMISTLTEGTSDVTDKTEILTSYASDNGFADSAAQNVVYKRKANKLYNYINKKLKDDHAGLDKVGTVTSVTVTGSNGLSGTGTITTSGTITLSNSGVRSTTINGNYLRVNTNGTNADLTIPYAITANSANWLNPNSDLTYGASGLQYFNTTLSTRGEANTNGTPTNDWYHIIRMNHANKGGYYVDLAACFHSSQLHYRRIANGTNYDWVRLLDYGMTSSPKAISHTNWSGTDDRSSVIPTLNFLSYWNGAYNSSNSSNLTYCANGTILGSNNYTSYVNETNFPGIKKTGTVTKVSTGTGLTGGDITTTGTISINSTYQTYISNGNTAYGWGNHASAKYIKAVGRHSGSMNLNTVDSTMSIVTEIRPSEITTTNLPSDYGTSYGCMISVRDGNSNYGHGKMQILGCNKKFWMRATQGAGEANDGTWCRLALTSDIGNGTVTINQAGASKGSFTLNQSTAATINLTDTNYYHTRVYSSGLKISTGTGVSNMYVPTGTTSSLGVVKQHTASDCTSYTSDEGATTPAAVKKAVGLFAVTKVSTGTGLTGGDITSTGTISINSTYQTYISNGNTAHGWGNHANAGYIKSTSILKGWSDTRSAATKPNDYNGAFKVIGIKSAGTTLGLTSTQAGSYATIIGWRGWSDSSGGYAWEIASTDKNRLYVRSGSTTSWNNGWQAIAYTSDIPTKTSQLTNNSGYITATSLDGYVNEIETSGSGNAITSASKSGKKITFTKGTTFLTAHQTIYSLTIKNSAGTEQLTYTPNSDAGSITLTKAMVGLGNVDNTADADKTVAVANKLGTATKGSVTKPIYLKAGTATECNTYAGGTAVTLNGSSKAASTASFYAPTTAGTSGYLLKSNGSGAPTWTNTIGSSTTALGTSYITNMYADALYLKSYCPTSGDIYISGFTTVPNSTSRVRLYTAKYALIKNNNNSSTCAIYAPGGFYESSDERLKQLLNPLQVSLDDICKLRKIYYTWKDDPNSGRQLGVVAQDVQKLYPELVDINTDTGYLSLAYDKLSVIALGAIDKLYEIFKKLSLENESLKNRLENLEKLI